VKKRNAALEALLGAGYAPTPEAPPATLAEEASATVVAMRPVKAAKGVAKVMVYMPAKVARKCAVMLSCQHSNGAVQRCHQQRRR
jgi:hypothetical protein